MKNTRWFVLFVALAFPLLTGHAQTPGAQAPEGAAQAPAAAPVTLSPGAAEVIRLASSGVSDDVVMAYVENSQAEFNLTADDVLYLKDVGLSPEVTSAMLTHDSKLRGQPQQYAPATASTTAQAALTPAQAPGHAPSTYDWQSPVTPAAPAQAAPAPAAPVSTIPPPTYVSSPSADVTYFYNSLSPYGTWVQLEGYGWCWQPSAVVISPGWRPYCNGGHWVYTDAGWYWQSDYSWGWAPFHYGRWYSHPNCGWVWMPDRVWGPAWVTWRVAGDTCGWAPLPPHAEFDVRLGWRYNGVSVGASFAFGLGANAFAFVSFGNFCNHNLAPHCLPPARVQTVYSQTTIINNYVVNNKTIVHRGVPIERVSAASHVPVPRATVRDWHAAPNSMPSRTASVVYRPQLQAPARPAPMVAQKVDTHHPVIRHSPVASVKVEPSSARRSAAAPARVSRGQTKEVPRTSLPANNNPRIAAPPSNTTGQKNSADRNPHVYYPKGYYQNSEIRSLPQSDQHRSQRSRGSGDNSDSRGRSKP